MRSYRFCLTLSLVLSWSSFAGVRPPDKRPARAQVPVDESRPTVLPSGGTFEGYADKLSYFPGDEAQFAFRVYPDGAKFHIRIYRVGAHFEQVYPGPGDPPEMLTASEQRYPADWQANGGRCDWKPDWKLTIPSNWRPGYYTLRAQFTGIDDRQFPHSEIFFVVRAAPAARPAVLLVLSTNTWEAYNDGALNADVSLYHGRRVEGGYCASFKRPLRAVDYRPGARLHDEAYRYIPAAGYWPLYNGSFYSQEWPFVRWAESHGYVLDYATSLDLEDDRTLNGRRAVLSVGHDEYWSKPMRDHLEAFVRNGGNAVFFSGNLMHFQVRSPQNGGQPDAIVCFKEDYDNDPEYDKSRQSNEDIATLFSSLEVGRPENRFLGVGMRWGGMVPLRGEEGDYHREAESQGRTALIGQYVPYTVHRTEGDAAWVFAGTNLHPGDLFGGADGNACGVVGYECDGCDLDFSKQPPEPTGVDGCPLGEEGFHVLASAPAAWDHESIYGYYYRYMRSPDAAWLQYGRLGSAVMGYRHVDSKLAADRGVVFTVGVTDWALGLSPHQEGTWKADPAVERITRNVLDTLAEPGIRR